MACQPDGNTKFGIVVVLAGLAAIVVAVSLFICRIAAN